MDEVFEAELYRPSGAKVRLTSYQTLGWRIFLAVIFLIVLMTVVVFCMAWITYPTLDGALKVSGASTADGYKMWREAKAEWNQQLVSVAQLALFGSLIPLLGTIAGYLLGQRAASEAKEAVETI